MTGQTLGDVLRQIGRQAGLQSVLALTDAQLLERFADGRDEPAFAALMVRHGPMVLGVCRRLLHDAGQAEDAFQAAFLVLARKAGAIQRRPLLAAWLYGVAYKVAARVRGRAWRRCAHEKSGAEFASAAAPEPPDPMPELHEEVQRLPDKYRNPVVLCYLEGKTHEEAALLLRWPIGTVKGRLARARDLLRSRLTRRGVGMSEESVATALPGPQATASPALLDVTIRAATQFAAGDGGAGGLVSARAAALTQGVLRTMILTKMKIVTVSVLALATLAGVGGYAGWGWVVRAEDAPKPSTRAADKPAPSDKGKDDKDAILGTWQVTAVEMGGKDVSGTDAFKGVAAAKWTFTADKLTVAGPGQGEHNSRYQLDPTKKPKELDVTPLDGPENEKGHATPAIYSLEGDVLKICIGSPDAPDRPTELASKDGTKNLLITFKRVEGGKEKPADKPREDKEAMQGAWVLVGREFQGEKKTFTGVGDALARWAVRGDKLTFKSGKRVDEDTIKLDPTASPKAIDKTKGKGQTILGIYKLEGDTLEICWGTDKERPTSFAGPTDKDWVLLVYKREKK